jgi:hypothetical protein
MNTKYILVTCESCGNEFDPRQGNQKRFCSRACYYNAVAPSPKTASKHFWTKVNTSGECWLWTGSASRGGHRGGSYGHFWDGVQNKLVLAHRFSYEMAHGIIIPADLTIDHLCKNTLCVRPDHLEVVTVRENVLRSDGLTARYARRTHCNYGHPFDEANTIFSSGERRCRECKRINSQKQRARKRAVVSPQTKSETE